MNSTERQAAYPLGWGRCRTRAAGSERSRGARQEVQCLRCLDVLFVYESIEQMC